MDFFTTAISPEQYEGFHASIYVSDFDNFEHVIIVVDDWSGSKQKSIDPFFNRDQYKDVEIYWLSGSYSDLPKRTVSVNSTKTIFLDKLGRLWKKINKNCLFR